MDAMDIDAMQKAAAGAARLLKTLADPERLMLLCQLWQREMTVGELESSVCILQPALSQQLAVLHEEALVHTRREDKSTYYSVCDKTALAVLEVLYEQFCQQSKNR
jgi:ArsR family transcriptional regulator